MTDGSSARKSIADSAKEAAVIIFSILVAFSLDAWWEEIQIERDVLEILRAVESELNENLSALDATIEHHEIIAEAIVDLRNEGFIEDISRDVFVSAVIEVEVFDPGVGAIDTFFATGLLGEIEDTELRLLLGSYGTHLRDLNEQETRAGEFRDATRRQVASLGIPVWQIGVRENVIDDVEMLNLLTMRAVEERNSITSAKTLQDHIRKILARLDETA